MLRFGWWASCSNTTGKTVLVARHIDGLIHRHDDPPGSKTDARITNAGAATCGSGVFFVRCRMGLPQLALRNFI
jgi:hypothetical protein